MPLSIQRLQTTLGYEFADPGLLELALTHRSKGSPNNERLEFLGDSVVNHIITEQLYNQFPRAREGDLSRMRAALVKGETLAEVARELQLDDFVLLGPGELKSGARRRDSIMADTFEAVLGAMLMDADLELCRGRVLLWFRSRLAEASPERLDKDPKTRLQEYLQQRGMSRPQYQVVRVSGEGHDSRFLVNCALHEYDLSIEGKGTSRQRAEQEAAAMALERLESNG
jgi:ribonuclease-3